MASIRQLARRTKLRHLLFLLLLLSGIIPLATISFLITVENREILESQEKSFLARSAEALSDELGDHLEGIRRQLAQLGHGFLVQPGPEDVAERLRQPWARSYWTEFMLVNSDRLLSLRIQDPQGQGPWLGRGDLGDEGRTALRVAFEQARSRRATTYVFLRLEPDNLPTAVLAVPVIAADEGAGEDREPRLILEAVVRLQLVEGVLERETQQGEVAVFLIDSEGKVLWSSGAPEEVTAAVRGSSLIQDFRRKPLNLAAEYVLDIGDQSIRMVGQVSPVEATGWGVVVHKPAAAAFAAVQRMVSTAAVSSAVLVVLALVFAIVVARSLSSPIQRLAETSHQIASGHFGRRVEVSGIGREMEDLARDFNRMSAHVQSYVEQLRNAALGNRELFINSLRAFAAAIDAKDPYTRGHSERVARYSRVIACSVGSTEEFQERAWVAALLHDVGKIGIDDRVLKKGGVLTAEEYELMKVHPVIGEEILSPIVQLREMLPAVRWHHEAWNGMGYPDRLKGDQIPLIARIVGVADTFDAITTNRPYQHAYTPQFALERITQLTGSRFDAKIVTAFLRAFEERAIVVNQPASDPSEAQRQQARA